MLNPFKEVDWNPDLAARKAFARSLVIGFPCVALIFLLVLRIKHGDWDSPLPFWIAGLGVLVGGLLFFMPVVAKPFYLIWYGLACCVGLVMGNVLLGLIYYAFVTGIALVMKLLGRDPMSRRLDRSAKSYWRNVEQPSDPRRYYRQF